MVDPELEPADPFDVTAFREEGHALVELLAEHLTAMQSEAGRLPKSPVLASVDPDRLWAEAGRGFGSAASAQGVAELFAPILSRSNHLHHPGYIGHQVATVAPLATLVECANAMLNNGMAVYEMGQLQTVHERRVVKWLCERLGFGGEADGVLTHGGSLGNLTALLAARQASAEHDVWSEGQRDSCAVLVSDQAHYCVARSVQVMGWGVGGAVSVATDAQFRLDPADLGPALARARAAGRRVVAVVASSCSTAAGAFDPIPAIADFCAAEGLWLHVDGAHGASMVLSDSTRAPLAGVERADSVVWDLHKMMMLPALVTGVLFREGRRSYEAFAQEAAYLFSERDPREDWFDVGRRTLECTKRAMGVTASLMLERLGTGAFVRHVERLCAAAREFAGLLTTADDFELATDPECNIVCFRHLGAAPDALDAHQAHLRRTVVARGKFYIVQARLRGSTWLRVTVMNPATSDAHFALLLDEIRAVAST